MKKLFIALALGAASVSSVAYADIGIDARQVNQQRQIDAGKRSGQLSLRERQTLTNEQRAIKRQEGALRARHGGSLTNRDEARIMAMLDRAQANIERLKRNHVRGRNGIHL